MGKKIPREKIWSHSRKYTIASSMMTHMIKAWKPTTMMRIGRLKLEEASPIRPSGKVFHNAEHIILEATSKKILSGKNTR
jgi:hypothetical protein